MDDRLVIFRGAATLADVDYGPTIDDAYEADLQACRVDHHAGRLFWFMVDGLEVAVCSRCHTRLKETP